MHRQPTTGSGWEEEEEDEGWGVSAAAAAAEEGLTNNPDVDNIIICRNVLNTRTPYTPPTYIVFKIPQEQP